MSSDGSKHDGSDGTTIPSEGDHTPHNGHQPKVHGEGEVGKCRDCFRLKPTVADIIRFRSGAGRAGACWKGVTAPFALLLPDEELSDDPEFLRQRLKETRLERARMNCTASRRGWAC